MPDYERLLGKLEQGIENLSEGQTTMIADLSDHRKETADLHRAAAQRTSEAEVDIERIEAKVDGHSNEDEKRFALLWKIGGVVSGLLGTGVLIAARASGYL
jgi:hypothetical protein